jgi:hypothetical protein
MGTQAARSSCLDIGNEIVGLAEVNVGLKITLVLSQIV